jgi:hypothetical protein
MAWRYASQLLKFLFSRSSMPSYSVDLFTFLTLSNSRVSFGIREEYAKRSGPNAER